MLLSKLKIVRNIFKSNKFVPIAMMFQMIFIFSLVIPIFSVLKENFEGVFVKDTPFEHSIYYMGTENYYIPTENGVLTNDKEQIENKLKVFEYIKKFPNIFIGRSPMITDVYSDSDNGETQTLEVYDIHSLKTIFKNSKANIDLSNNSVLVHEKFKDRFKINDNVNFKLDGKVISLKIADYYTDDIKVLQPNIISFDAFRIENLFVDRGDLKNENVNFIILNSELIEKEVYDKDKIYPQGAMIYLNSEVKREDLKDFENFIKENNLGYYQYSWDLISEQIKFNEDRIQRFFDPLVATVIVVLFSILSIGYVNKGLLERRFKVYYYNGAKLIDIFTISLLYYLIITFFAFVTYSFIIFILNIEPIFYYFTLRIRILSQFRMDSGYLDMQRVGYFLILTVPLVVINSLLLTNHIKKKMNF